MIPHPNKWRNKKRKMNAVCRLDKKPADEEIRWDTDETQKSSLPPPPPPADPVNESLKQQKSCPIRTYEEEVKKKLALKKKELRWKLLQANEARCRAKLEDIRVEANYHRHKLSKAKELAAKLRAEYLELVKSTRLLETESQKADSLLELQEKYFTEERLQTTKSARDCLVLGKELYGDDYKLPTTSNGLSVDKLQALQKKQAEINHRQGINDNLMEKLSPFIRTARSQAPVDLSTPPVSDAQSTPKTSQLKAQAGATSNKKRRKTPTNRLGSLLDLRDRGLRNIASLRLTGSEDDAQRDPNNVNSHNYTCLPDLIGKCSDNSCPYQHKSRYSMKDIEKLTDLLCGKPSSCDPRPDSDLSGAENSKLCRNKLKQRVTRLISENPGISIESIAQIVAKSIRVNHKNNSRSIECSSQSGVSGGDNEAGEQSDVVVKMELVEVPPETADSQEKQ